VCGSSHLPVEADVATFSPFVVAVVVNDEDHGRPD
jgi:hypothetical protein